MNVDAMLRRVQGWQLMEWTASAELDPFDDDRGDYRIALLCQLIANVHRDPKRRRKPFELEEFLLRFDKAAQRKKKQAWQEQKAIIMAMFGEGG